MKYLKAFVVAILLISLFLNYSMLSRINNIENRVNSIGNYQTQIANSVNGQSNNINNILNDFVREQSWISSIRMDIEAGNIEQGKATLNFEWQVKELYKNSEVVFHYLQGEEEAYSSIPAKELENGLFEVNFPIKAEFQPEWHISLTATGSSSAKEQEDEKRAMEEKMKKESNNQQLSYYVTVSTDDLVKSSDLNKTYIGNLGAEYYGFLDTFVNITDESYNVSVHGAASYGSTALSLQEVYLLKYQGGQLVGEEKLVAEEELVQDEKNQKSAIAIREQGASFFTQPTKEKFEYTKLVLKAVYSNGVSFEREIYSKIK